MLLLLGLLVLSPPAEAFEELRRKEAAQLAAGAPIDDEALGASLATVLALTDNRERDAALTHFAARLVAIGEREPERALRWLPKLPYKNQGNYIPRLRATEHLFRRWVHRDAQAAAAAALQFWRDGGGHPVSDLLHEWVSFAPRDAIAWVRALDEKERTQLAAYEQLLGALPAIDHRVALELAETVPARYSYALIGAYSQILPRLVTTDVEAALAAYGRYEERAPADAQKCVGALVRAWAERQPEKAVTFTESHLAPEEPRRYAALLGIATVWSQRAPRPAADLALRATREQRQHRAVDHDHRHGPREDPLADIVAGWAKKKRAAALAWVEAIEEPDLEEHLLRVLGVQRQKPTPPPPRPSKSLAGATTPAELKYGLIDYYGGVFFCDRDQYPVHDSGAEQRRAREVFPTIVADAAHYAAITKRLRVAPGAAAGPELELQIYREHKKLGAVKLEPTPAGYDYELAVADAVVRGRIERSTIVETSRKQRFNTCPVCLADTTRIDTPAGPVPVTELRVGSLVWTRSAAGERVAAPLLLVGSTKAPAGHAVVKLSLQDGRSVSASASHPLDDGRRFGALRVGDLVDGAAIASLERVPYEGSATYDVLPAGDTGVYWADGVPLATTLPR